MGYLVISRCEDEPHIEWFDSKEALLADLNEELEDWDEEGDGPENMAYHYVERGCDTPPFDEWPSRTKLVIKGEVVVAKPKQVVKRVDVK